MPNINIFFNEQELEALEFRMKTCGETAKSTHIKRVYFEGGKQDNAQLGRMQRQLDLLTESNEQMAKTLRHLMQMKVDSTELTLLSGLYTMIHASVEPAVRKLADRYIQAEAVEQFLTKENEK